MSDIISAPPFAVPPCMYKSPERGSTAPSPYCRLPGLSIEFSTPRCPHIPSTLGTFGPLSHTQSRVDRCHIHISDMKEVVEMPPPTQRSNTSHTNNTKLKSKLKEPDHEHGRKNTMDGQGDLQARCKLTEYV
jgi:hypothetical protein